MKRFDPNLFPPLRARLAGSGLATPAFSVSLAHDTWPAFWSEVQRKLLGHGYARVTLLFYRHILRAFSRHAAKPPRQVTAADLHAYLGTLGRDRYTWHWTAMNLSVLRTLFDKLGGLHALSQRRGPRRKRALPEYLDRAEIGGLIEAASCLRDQLLIALLYGCGLKTGELRRLTWGDMDTQGATLRVPSRWRRPDRQLPIPVSVKPLLLEGRSRCLAEQPIFSDPSGRKPLSSRRIQVLVREIAQRAGIQKLVLPVTLRHSYAVHYLQDGGTIRALQENLDHRLLETTARYLDITGLPEREPPPAPLPLPAATSFIRELTDRFTRNIKGIRLFMDSA